MAAVANSSTLDLSSRSYVQDPSAPDPVRPHAGALADGAGDAIDDLFNYDAQIDDTFRDAENNNNNATDTDAAVAARRRAACEEDGDLSDGGAQGLGIDEEVKVRKARAPIAKLDEPRLLSDKGIPRLRKITKERLKSKGKGHEYSDVARLLSTYQLWLDDLFPKAKFADGLTIIEKLGHSRRLQVMRKEWIDEGKPKPAESDSSDDEHISNDPAQDETATTGLGGTDGTAPADSNLLSKDRQNPETDTPMADDLYAPPSPRFAPSQPSRTNHAHAEPEGDELDQLLAEDAQTRGRSPGPDNRHTGPQGNEFEDEEEAMAGMDW